MLMASLLSPARAASLTQKELAARAVVPEQVGEGHGRRRCHG